MKGIELKWGLKEIVLALIAIAIGIAMAVWAMGIPWAQFFGFKLGKETFAGEPAPSAEPEYSSRFYTQLDYSGYLYPHQPEPGEVGIDPALSWTEIKERLNERGTVYACADCSGCEAHRVDPVNAPDESEKCDSCNSCEVDGKTVTQPGRFVSCGTCERCTDERIADEECTDKGKWDCNDCIDSMSETELCAALTKAIRNAYLGLTDDERTLLADFPKSGALNPSEILTMIKACPAKAITIRKGGIDQEICYFNPDVLDMEAEQPSDSFYHAGMSIDMTNCDKYDCIGGKCCYGRQSVTAGQNLAITGAHGVWTPGTEDKKDKKRYFFLCKGDCPSFAVIADESKKMQIKVSDLCDSLEWWQKMVGGAWLYCLGTSLWNPTLAELGPEYYPVSCSVNDTEGCIIDWSTCENCLHQQQFFSFENNVVVNKIGARVCTELKSTADYVIIDCRDQSSNALDELFVQPNIDSGLSYAQCELDIPDGTNKLYYNEYAGFSEPGHMRLRLSGLQAERQRECHFNLQLCAERAFANNTDSSTIKLFDFFRDFSPYNAHRTYFKDGNGFVIWDKFVFELDENYKPSDIANAIIAGMREWTTNSYPGYFGSSSIEPLNHPFLDIGFPEGTDSSTCTNPSLDFIRNNFGRIFYNCPGGDCGGTLTVRVAMTWVEGSKANAAWPVITFCASD